jgi:hypothetical protein
MVTLAFWRERRKANTIRAIVVDGVFFANPPEFPVLSGIKISELLLIPPTLTLCLTELGIYRRLTTVNVEALVGGYEGSLGPVSLLQATPRRPVICIPKA